MKVCSFLPGATDIVYQLGLESYLDGVTFECPSDKPKVVHSRIEGNNYTSAEIDQIVSETKQAGEDLYYVDMDLLTEIEPDVVLTQDLCDVCQISTSVVERAIGSLEKQPKVIPLKPRRLSDIYDNVYTIATEFGEEQVGLNHLARLENRVHDVTDQLRKHQAATKRVMIMEWIDPIFNSAHWVPDQIALAGGVDMLANPAGDSIVIPWEKVKKYDPDVLVIAACGLEADQTMEEMERITTQPGWNELTAVQNEDVYLVDSFHFTKPSTTVVDGIELLAALLHPHLFEIPEKDKDKVRHFTSKQTIVK